MSDISIEELQARIDAVKERRAARVARVDTLYNEMAELYRALASIDPACTYYANECQSLGHNASVEKGVLTRQTERMNALHALLPVKEVVAEPEVNSRRVNPTPIPNRQHGGYMMRLGGLRKPEWQRRYFQVRDGYLYRYGEFGPSGKPKGCVPIDRVQQVGPVQVTVERDKNPFTFAVKIHSGAEGEDDIIEYFSCVNDESRLDWMLAVSPPAGITSMPPPALESGAQWSRRRAKSPFS